MRNICVASVRFEHTAGKQANLANNPKYANKVAELHKLLNAGYKSALPQ